ncbi:sugar ABC transporter substrate-binding protein [Kaistia dalseonensis]|uniref:Lactose/L-arabinose transport system substrate-binding protein n=2 Tax=Kaistia dalseonensis TaxID=410840 RepID=A0ABU0H044_9HYPH|nr:sugar ABC transporter substrate-binding protein [Kaistia dalseonensis]MCX5493123.1 sugar ABC transporter substrate-binding protein [Kaistia dalseonensis]MDQ0435678.1 lactose/L-arabinose transport system substrate-binding protein [Kaistia dalseonensis]
MRKMNVLGFGARAGGRFAAALVGAALLASTAFVGAASASELTVWCWDPNFNIPAMSDAAARYTKTHPDTTFNVANITQDEINQKLQTQFLAGVSDGLPDIVLIQDDNVQRFLQSFPGSFVPLSDSIDMSKFAQYKVAAATHDGKSYSLPFDSGVAGLFYRSDYLEQAGYKPEDLQNISWNKLIEIGKDVLAKTGHQLVSMDYNGDDLVILMMQSTGQWYLKNGKEPNILDNPALKTALQTFQTMAKDGLIKPVSGWTDYTGSFTSGQVAAVPQGVWITGTIKSVPDQSGKWRVAPMPILEGVEGATHFTSNGGSSWYVLASSKHQDEAVDFLKTIWGADVDFYQGILVNQGAVGSLLAAREGAAYKASDPFFNNEPVWQNFSDWLAKVPTVDYGTYTPEARMAVRAQIPAIANGGNIDEALQAIDAQLRQQMQ